MSVKTNLKDDIDILLPKLYKVIILNDDYTTFDFVINILKSIFNKTEEEAINLTLKIDREGSAVVGVYPYEIAITKVHYVHDIARKAGFPLRARIEEE